MSLLVARGTCVAPGRADIIFCLRVCQVVCVCLSAPRYVDLLIYTSECLSKYDHIFVCLSYTGPRQILANPSIGTSGEVHTSMRAVPIYVGGWVAVQCRVLSGWPCIVEVPFDWLCKVEAPSG